MTSCKFALQLHRFLMEEGLHAGIQHFPGLCRTLRRKCQTQHLRLQAVYLLFILQKRQGAGIVDRIAAETALVPYRKYLLFAIPQIQIFRTFTASFHCFPDALGGYHDRDRTIYEKFPFPAAARLQLPAVELDRKGKTHRKLRRHLPHKILIV